MGNRGLLVLRRAGCFVGVAPHSVALLGVSVLTGFFASAALLDAASPSRPERAI